MGGGGDLEGKDPVVTTGTNDKDDSMAGLFRARDGFLPFCMLVRREDTGHLGLTGGTREILMQVSWRRDVRILADHPGSQPQWRGQGP